ncbi:hypothetical protein ACWD47_38240, partial [Streptomyces sp. NPDC002516]
MSTSRALPQSSSGVSRQTVDTRRARCHHPARAGWPLNTIVPMSKPDELLVDIATVVESGQSNQMS